MSNDFKVTFMGASGSSAGSTHKREIFGNNTSCIMVQAGERDILLDLGTGCLPLVPYFEKKYQGNPVKSGIDILIGHFHYDHIEGFQFFKPLFNGKNHHIFAQCRNGKGVKEVFREYLKPPFTPVSLEHLNESISFLDFDANESFYLGKDVFVETAETNHPNGCTAYKIHYGGASLVYMLDHEHGTEKDEFLEKFAQGCDLLIYDACYTEEEYHSGGYIGWGHSTYQEGVDFAKRAKVKKVVFSHHAQWRSDQQLFQIEEKLQKEFPFSYVASEGMTVTLLQDKKELDVSRIQPMLDKEDCCKLMETCMSFSTERDVNRLLERILHEAMRITHCDGGTIYFYNGKELEFKIIHNYSMNIFLGGNGDQVDLPPVPMTDSNVCSYAAIHRKSINIHDVTKEDKFDFCGTLRYDEIMKYHTQSLLVHPLINNQGELVGVMQLINALDKDGNVIHFEKSVEQVIAYWAGHAAISLTNAIYVMEIENLLHSLVEVLTTAIDQRSPYTANHTKNVAMYTSLFIDYLNALPKEAGIHKHFTEQEKKQLIMAAMLHDVGKLATPTEIINKSTRLSVEYDRISQRLKWIDKSIQLDLYEGRVSEVEKREIQRKVSEARKVMENVNAAIFLNDELLEQARKVIQYAYMDASGERIPFFTPYEAECLQILKGTFTMEERAIMEQHVERTRELLVKIPFQKGYKQVIEFAVQHHETLDGKGYPLGLTKKDIPLESRILAVIDIFDALTAKDRPYKDVISVSRAYEILEAMVLEGKLDAEVFTCFKESGIGRIAVLSQQKGETVQW